MFIMHTSLARRLQPAAGLLLAALAAGCSDGVARYPVEGQVLLNGQPLRGMTGSVQLLPDPSRGNTIPMTPAGPLDAEGRFKVASRGKPGAPAGWYKVVVSAVPPGTDDRDVVKRPPLHPRFTGAMTTPLAVEVVAKPPPGAYDLNVTRN